MQKTKAKQKRTKSLVLAHHKHCKLVINADHRKLSVKTGKRLFERQFYGFQNICNGLCLAICICKPAFIPKVVISFIAPFYAQQLRGLPRIIESHDSSLRVWSMLRIVSTRLSCVNLENWKWEKWWLFSRCYQFSIENAIRLFLDLRLAESVQCHLSVIFEICQCAVTYCNYSFVSNTRMRNNANVPHQLSTAQHSLANWICMQTLCQK